ASTDVMLTVIVPDLMYCDNKRRLNDADDFVRFEIETARKRGIRVIPVLLRRGERLPLSRYLPPRLRDLLFRNAVQVRPDPDFHRDMDRLIDGIITLFEMEPTS